MGCVYAYVIVLTLVGPEYRKRSFDVANDDDMREAAGAEAIARLHPGHVGTVERGHSDDIEKNEIRKSESVV